ncbi:MAG: glycoside hydrolase family 2 TIM barrel-domain containing protein [Nibricoccus sp.]
MLRRLAILVFSLATLCSLHAQSLRDRLLWDDRWRFALGDIPEAKEPAFNDSAWRQLHLPHDWSIEGQTDPNAPTAGGGGFFPTGIGWYRRSFIAPTIWIGKRVQLEFEGVAGQVEIWLNGKPVAAHPNSFTSFFADLTPHLKHGRDNFLALRVDNSKQPNTRYYTGSGLYRHVWLNVTGVIHQAPWSVFVSTTELTAERATIAIRANIKNFSDAPASVALQTQVFGPDDRPVEIVSETVPPALQLIGGGNQFVTYNVTIKNPKPWHPDTPVLYHAITRVLVSGRVVDEVSTPFGVRTLKVSAARGFELNGQPVKLRGGNVHSDQGPLGAAAFDRAEERKVQLLKSAGYNAARTAHNPVAPAFLEACDRLGLLVIEEAFDCWEKGKVAEDYSKFFKDWWQRDIDAMVMRDRNHPSVVMWSTGNELYERGNANGLRIATELAARIRSLDTTRPLTAGINGLGKGGDWTKLDPLFATLDAAGYNYELTRHADDHTRLPARVIYSSESYQTDTFQNWSTVLSQPYIVGDFVWSAIDYLGEAGIGRIYPPSQTAAAHWIGNHYPWHGGACGDLDITGIRRPESYYRELVWGVGVTKLYAAVVPPTSADRPWNTTLWSVPPAEAHWNWTGYEGKPLQVVVFSRYDAVRLLLNGKNVGEKNTSAATQYKATFSVPYAEGKLVAVAFAQGKEAARFTLQTAENDVQLRLTADRKTMRADSEDLIFINVEVVDKNGTVHSGVNQSVHYTVSGPATLAAIGSADLASTEPYNANPRRLHDGRSLIVLRSTAEPGKITFTATAPGMKPASVTLESKSSL